METSALGNLLDPAILFFFLGALIGFVRSNLEIPSAITKFLSLYLLVALGFKGGQALADAGFTSTAVKVLLLAIVISMAIPAWSFLVLRRRVNPFDAAAIAATYGSVSAVTFIAASQFVASRGDEAGGYMTVALVIMESPAIVMAVLLATWVRSRQTTGAARGAEQPATALTAAGGTGAGIPVDGASAPKATPLPFRAILREAFTDGSHLLLIGSLVVGFISSGEGAAAMTVFTDDIFKGMLAFFLLEMGLLVSRQLREARDVGPFLVGFGVVMPLLNATVALALGSLLGLDRGDLTLLAVLAASASYIVVPAVVRFAIPEARPSRYFTMALAVTFPFNIVLGIPLYYAVAGWLSG